MLTESHDLAQEFPEHKDTIHTLKTDDNHFARLFNAYEKLNSAILRSEKGVEPLSDDHMNELKKQRLALKDELLAIIEKTAA